MGVAKEVKAIIRGQGEGTTLNSIAITLDNVGAGLYVADLQTADGLVLRRKVVVR